MAMSDRYKPFHKASRTAFVGKTAELQAIEDNVDNLVSAECEHWPKGMKVGYRSMTFNAKEKISHEANTVPGQ